MVELTSAMQTNLESGSINARWVLTVWPRDFETGTRAEICLWTGDDTRSVDLNGSLRLAYPGTIVDMSAPTSALGLDVRSQSFTLFAGSDEVIDAIQRYDAHLAPAELHLLLLDPGGHNQIGSSLVFKGFVDAAPIDRAAQTIDVSLVSQVQAGTGFPGLKKSDASQRLRDANDSGRKYADIAGAIPVRWGDELHGHRINRPT